MEQINKRAPIRRTKAERDELVAKWRGSGKSVAEFAAEHGLASSSVYQWIQDGAGRGTKSKAAKSNAAKRKAAKRKAAKKAAFAEVNVVGQATARNPAMTVALRGGHSVTFEGPAVDPAWLESVLKVVSAC